ncbi:hypothetical protein JG687_00009928 [Phytophthora cactorum]|uniref:Uncharacterized protein n=1 Tax=Phytophthora cactorum TaxID=29920 RepID=A0A8T1U8H1_9STRA|nr:hypothetical protein JG687_00009928 [Phytophthora cactorum]
MPRTQVEPHRLFSSLIHPLPGGTEQEPHQDYTPVDVERAGNLSPPCIPASALVALEHGTSLRVFEGCFC